MKRYEIQEMLSQSEQGVAYLAHDKEARRDVALRRFFPFGREAAGFDAEQQSIYRETCRKLMSITHTNLRFVIGGDVDPSDGTPYLATEWIEGNPLDQILAGTLLDPARTIDIVRCALEVSLELSAAFGQQAIWVETGLNSIVVGNVESDRGYTFWVCPLRWFNVAPRLREVSSLALMAEELIGWNDKLYSKEAAGGFGGWVKDMKSAPDISVGEALKRLNALLSKHQPKLGSTASSLSQPVALVKPTSESSTTSTSQPTPPTPKPVPKPTPKPVPKPVPRPVARPAATAPAPQPAAATFFPTGPTATQAMAPMALPQSKSKGITGALVVIAVCLAIASVFGYLVIQNRIKLREQLAKNAAIEKAEAEKLAQIKAGNSPAATSPPPDRPVRPAQPSEITAAAMMGTPAASGDVPVFLANQISEMRGLGSGKPVKLTGTLFAVRKGESPAENDIQLWFDDPANKKQAYARAVGANFEGTLNLEMFQSYVGKRIVVEGEYFYEKHLAARHRVDFTRASQVYLADDQSPPAAEPKPANPSVGQVSPAIAEGGVPVFTPKDIDGIDALGSRKAVKLRGTLVSVSSSDGKNVRLIFGIPTEQQKYIYGKAYRAKFKGDLSPELFSKFVGKEIVIEGTFYSVASLAPYSHFVNFNRLDQVYLADE